MSERELRAAKLRYEATIRDMLVLKAPYLSSSQKETLWTVCSNLETLLLDPNLKGGFPESFQETLTRAFNILRGLPEPKPEKSEPKLAPPRMEEKTVQFHIKCLAGRILTLIDAMFTNEAQNKAFKGLVKKEFREQLHRVFGFFHHQDNEDHGDEKCEENNVDLS